MSNDTPKRPRLAYYQAASLTLLLAIAGFSIAGLWGLVGLAAPAVTIHSFAWRELNTRSQYLRENYQKRRGLYHPTSGPDTAGITLDEATERWRDLRADALALERQAAARTFILWLIALVVCAPLYAYHYRIVARAAAAETRGG